MKKEYLQPETEVLLLVLEQCITASNVEDPEEEEQGGLF